MFVVPVHGDKIKTKDNSDPCVVSSYSSLKDEPAVYLVPSTSRDRYVYFSDLVEINGVTVEYDSESKCFNALGPLRRKFNLPQPGDTITVKLMDVNFKDETEDFEVESLKLHSKKYGIGRGLLVCSGRSTFSLNELLDVKRKSWTEKFNSERFKRYYLDYAPLGLHVKA